MKERLIVYYNKRLHLLQPDDICCIEGDGSYAIISLRNGQQMRVSKNLKNLFAEMPNSFTQFLRVHKSWLVNINHLEYIYAVHDKSWFLHLSNNTEVPLSGSPNTILEMLNVKSSYMRQSWALKANQTTKKLSKPKPQE